MKSVRYPYLLALVLLIATLFSGCLDQVEWDHGDQQSPKEIDSFSQSQSHSYRCDHHDEDQGDHEENASKRDPGDAYENATPRYHNEVEGEEESRRTIDIPAHTDTLRVALIHDSHNEYRFRLDEPQPLGVLPVLPILHDDPVAEEKGDGHKYMDEPEWVLIHNPTRGEWTLTIDIDGWSKYTVAFYLD